MEELIDRLITFVSDLPVGLIIFLLAIAFSFFGGGKKKPGQAPESAPRPAGDAQSMTTSSDPFGRRREAATTPRSSQHTFASDERRAREERERQHQEVMVFGGLDFGSRGSLFDDEGEDRDSQWGKTKYGFDDSEWGSTFGERKSSEPIIR
jgi:hypothetical protein